jgi:putative peptidoglycan lipid II flippase
MGPLAHGGLALATSLAAMLNIGLLTLQLRKKIGRMDGRRILSSLFRIIPASLAMAAIGWWVSRDPVWDVRGNTLYKSELLAGTMAVSVLFYVLAMWIVRSEELNFLWGMVKRKKGSRDKGQGV